MQRVTSGVFFKFGCALFALSAVGFGQQSNGPTYKLLTTITLPGGLAGFDISWVDAANRRLYITDQTTTKGGGRVDVIDTVNDKYLYSIPQTPSEIAFAGANPGTPGCAQRGPDGVLAIPELHQLYVGDGDSTVKVVDLDAKAVVAVIPTLGKCRADELAYDPLDQIVMIANDNDNPPFLTFISTATQSVVGTFTYPGTQSTYGLEQPIYNPKTKRFNISVPANKTNQGSIDVFNPTTFLMEQSYPTKCSPSGLVLTPSQHLITACGETLDALTGNSLGVTADAAGDQIWYNTGDNFTYFGFFNGTFGGTTFKGVAVVDATSNKLLTYIPASTHTLAADPNNNHIYIPVSGSGIQVYAQQ